MDETRKKSKQSNPMGGVNFLSKQTFWWLNGLFTKGYKQPLENDDLYEVCPEDRSSIWGDKLEKEWQKELEGLKEGKQPRLSRAVVRTFGLQYMLFGLIGFAEECFKVGQPIILGQLIKYFEVDSKVSRTEAWLYVMGLSLSTAGVDILHHMYFFGVQRIGMRLRLACSSLMYKKSLKLSNKAMGETTTGQIVNLMSNDVNRFDLAVLFLPYLCIAPIEAIAIIVVLWQELGPSVLAGFFMLMLFIPLQGLMEKIYYKMRLKTAVQRDERIKVMSEIIAGMRVIKMYCWEKPFGQLVEKIRKNEIKAIHRAQRAESIVITPNFISDKVVLLATFFVLITWTDQAMTPYKVFLTVGIFQACRTSITLFIPFAMTHIVELKVSFQRIEKFLLLEEVSKLSLNKSNLHSDCSVILRDVTGKWEENVKQNTLENINLEVKQGQLIAAIGKVGCGKSSLLMALLGELPIEKGDVKVTGQIAYVSQQPWIFSGSIRQNILFGADFDQAKYNKVIYVAALKRDFEIMPDGDATLIGDRGVSLSGGQKARVSLARALYRDADIYLMDDPLSAVDAAVARHIFERCILKYLRNKPRILVTHQVQFLPDADNIYILSEGKISGQGSFSELSKSGVDFSELLKEEKEEQPASPTIQRQLSLPPVDGFGSMTSLGSMIEDYEPESVNLPEQEEHALGSVGFKVYLDYFKAGTGLFKFLLMIVIFIITQVLSLSSSWWLSQWSMQEESRYVARQEYLDFMKNNNLSEIQAANISTNITIPYVDSNKNISIFAAIIFASFLFGLARFNLVIKICVDASQTLHNRMFAQILRSAVLFFDTNPIGRILNRFSKDIGLMDDRLPFCYYDLFKVIVIIIAVVLAAGLINPYVFIPILPLTILFWIIRMYYMHTSRSIKRLEGNLRSPIYSSLVASLQGLATIRSMGMESICIQEFHKYLDGHSEAWLLFMATSRWLAVRLDWLLILFLTSVTVFAVLFSGTMNASLVGLSVTYVVNLMTQFQWGVRQSAETENHMISVERVLEYSKLPEEAKLESSPDKRPPKTWPMEGAIVADHVYLRYSPTGPKVLKDLSFSIKGKEKVGIVGRTGAGKSSLITALFRMAEPEGMVMIDGVNIQNIGLHDLRRNISIIPQDPFLFTGTLRKNLDPFSEYKDESLWRALDEVKLKEQIKDLPQELSTEVSEGGSNFSVGQRQLICLARAVLRNNRILLIDEATANVDPITDELIQATIRTKFKECTVLTIAHRLHTIMDSDRVLVLDNGGIMEFDTPYTLLSQSNGYFYDMAQQTGKAEFERLLNIAREADSNKSIRLTKAPSNGNAVDNDSIQTPMMYNLEDIEVSLNTASDETELRSFEKDQEDMTKKESHIELEGEEKDVIKSEEEEDDDEQMKQKTSSRDLKKNNEEYSDDEREALLSSDVSGQKGKTVVQNQESDDDFQDENIKRSDDDDDDNTPNEREKFLNKETR